MKTWTYLDASLFCGGCGQSIAAGKPVLKIVLPAVADWKYRCEQCAGEPVNVEHLEEAAKRTPAREVTKPTFVRVSDLKPALAFDPRMAQTGERPEET